MFLDSGWMRQPRDKRIWPELLDSRLQMRYFSAAHDLLDQTKCLNNGEHEQGSRISKPLPSPKSDHSDFVISHGH